MLRAIVPSLIFAVLVSPAAAQSPSPSLAGIWVLNPALTVRPSEIGFSHDWARAGEPAEAGERSGGGRGHRGSSGGGLYGPPTSRETADDGTRVQQLTDEARTPSSHVTIVQKPDSILITDDQGRSRTFHPTGSVEELTIGTVPLPTTARWDAGSLVVLYDVEQGRQLRYTYTPATNPTRLLVDIRFLERGHEGDEVKLTYEPPGEHDRSLLSTPPSAPAAPSSSAPGTMAPATAGARPPVLPPGSELHGLTTIGTSVDELSPQAGACGLDQAKIKTSIARILSNAGFKSDPYGNEESYVLVSVVTSKLPDGVCVSRYDASLVAQADATFPYLKGLVSVPVQLLHEGGISGGSVAVHGSAVMDALAKSVNSFVSQIRGTSK
ncbi:MAG TPA: hypothetical protein VH458_23170 [Vicinamibacterales bacterium]|jgi:hypothetical protein